MRQGISNAEACRTLKINRRTGMRWRHGRTVTNAQGRAKTYASISLKAPPTISSRYLSEGERIQIADALQVGKSLRQIAAELGRSPSTVSREVVRNRAPRQKRYAPRAAQALAEAARKRPRPGKIAGNPQLRDAISKTPSRTMEPQADQSPAADRFPGTARDERRAREHLSGLVFAAHHRAVPGNDPSPPNRALRAPDPPSGHIVDYIHLLRLKIT
ncbi:helix-turn-helix domain-containing protein [Cryobacterium tagatosivorans]